MSSFVINNNLNGNTPADQYQKLKLIQNSVRVYSSLYTSNLGPLNAYKKPTKATQGVCWNQMSDRPVPSVQKAVIPTGSNTSMNRRHTSVTSSKPGGQSPGGIGCDIKHNSYDRYLNRLKGKGPLRRGVVPPTFGIPIPFNPAFPIYGGKTIKTNIVSGCNCPLDETNDKKTNNNIQLYNNPLWQPQPSSVRKFSVGEYVYALQKGNAFYTRAIINSITNTILYTIQFDNGVIQTTNENELLIYYPCNCSNISNNLIEFAPILTTKILYGSICTISATKLTNNLVPIFT
jgi:hypothetical protein